MLEVGSGLKISIFFKAIASGDAIHYRLSGEGPDNTWNLRSSVSSEYAHMSSSFFSGPIPSQSMS